MACYSLTQQHPTTANWIQPSKRLELLAEEHQSDLDVATNHQLATRRRDRFGPNLPADRCLDSWQAVRRCLQVMLSIRYENGDPTRPFLDVSASSQPINEPEDIAATAGAAAVPTFW